MGLGEIIVGIFAILIGLLFAFQGNLFMRIMFPFIGFFTGFSVGAGALSAVTGDGFLSTVLGWVIGLFVGLLFAVLAYFFYAFAIVLAFAGLGFSLASGFLGLLNMDWSWLVVILGTFLGIVFGLLAMALRMPVMVLVAISGYLGAAIVIYGLMLVFNTAQLGDFSSGAAMEQIRNNGFLYLIWIVLGTAGCVAQLRLLSEEAKITQEYWDSSKTFTDLY